MADDHEHIHFGGFIFESDTLVLRQGADILPLKRQSAQVLALLIADAGEVVTRETIREQIWHDRTIEFDHGINACIRDIRRVLRDNASDPLYVETLPKIGYRFVGAVNTPSKSPNKQWPMLLGLAAMLLAVLSVVGLFQRDDAPAAPEERIAVMPFQSETGDDTSRLKQLSERAATRLSEEQGTLKVVSVAELFGDPNHTPGMGDVSRWLEVDYLVAGRFSEEGSERSITMRLIRTDGYIHIWSKTVAVPDGREAQVLDVLISELMGALPS